jgi:hypothetical protein
MLCDTYTWDSILERLTFSLDQKVFDALSLDSLEQDYHGKGSIEKDLTLHTALVVI